MSHSHILRGSIYVVLIGFMIQANGFAQVPEYDLLRTESEKDSLAAVEYPYIFPLFGENIVRKGFDLPYPLGISIGYYQQSMGVIMDRVSLGLTEGQLMPLAFIGFEDVSNKAVNYNARLDLWLLPFLNIYGMLGYAKSDADVTLNAPFEFETSVDFTGWTYGGGAAIAAGIRGFWVTVNGNLAWTDMEDYYDPVRATVFSFRIGHRLPLIKSRNFHVWLGAMYQDPAAEVSGRFLLADIVTDELAGQFVDYYLTDWYQALTPEEQQFIDGFVQTLMQGSADTQLDYQAEQHPENAWNMIAGAQLELSKSWNLQAEFGFLNGRNSLLVNLNYRLPF
ncbi:MAG: hypothetical protein JSV98_07935 [candidate division WOR-3 bacterium]|nr:MAG: hypothetical protein JSV98_07935 [candidate division WOR-3 bacterium]